MSRFSEVIGENAKSIEAVFVPNVIQGSTNIPNTPQPTRPMPQSTKRRCKEKHVLLPKTAAPIHISSTPPLTQTASTIPFLVTSFKRSPQYQMQQILCGYPAAIADSITKVPFHHRFNCRSDLRRPVIRSHRNSSPFPTRVLHRCTHYLLLHGRTDLIASAPTQRDRSIRYQIVLNGERSIARVAVTPLSSFNP